MKFIRIFAFLTIFMLFSAFLSPAALAAPGDSIRIVVKMVEQIEVEPAPDYTQSDVEELARIVYWEARGESTDGRLAVANVVLNRVGSDMFPGTIKKVVSQRGQFSPYGRADYYSVKVPDEFMSVAEMALSGEMAVSESVYWFRSDSMPAKWYDAVYTVTIGNHHFYSV